MKGGSNIISGWLAISRLPFHVVGLLPFILGAVMAAKLEGVFSLNIFLMGMFIVFFIMLSTYMAGEYWDYEEDTYSQELHNSSFAGGSRAIQEGKISKENALKGSILSLFIALILLIVLYFIFDTGHLTIPLGLTGMLGGFYYSSKPIRWVNTGLGELWIGFNYSWLPVASSYYILTGNLNHIILWIPIPIALSIINVVLLNEFPDYLADRKAGKNNILVRFGKEKGSFIYLILTCGEIVFFFLTAHMFELVKWWLYLPILLISLYIAISVLKCTQEINGLERLLALNILVNLGITSVYIVSFW